MPVTTQEPKDSANKAKKFAMWAAISCVIVVVLCLLLEVVAGVFGTLGAAS